MYELYEEFINAYKAGDEGRFTAAIRNWMGAGDEVPFEGEAGDLFFKANRAYHRWQSNAINRRYSKKQMIAYGEELAKLNMPNPYKKAEEPVAEPVVEPAIEPVVEQVAEPVVEHVVEHVMGVVPEEKHSLFGRKKKQGD